MQQGLLVRDLAVDDLGALLSLYRELHAEEAPIPDERHRRVWDELLSDARQVYIGGFADGDLAVACTAAIIPNLTRGARPYAVIENVVTATCFRRRGFGTVVMRALVERCWARDCYKVMLMSALGRSGAHEFYENLGFDQGSKQAFVMKR